jgi:F0F1-type ATP synthase delta subunit
VPPSAIPNVAATQLVDLFRSACGTAVDAELSNFIQLLSNNDRLALLPEIAGLYETYKQAEEGTKQAEIISAFPIDAIPGQRPCSATRSRLQVTARDFSVG